VSPAGEGVDRAHLDQLGARFGASFVAQLIDLFLEQAAGLLNAARAAVQVGDATAITAAAHALKSSAANVGARALSILAADVERLGRQGLSAADLTFQVDAMAEELERVSAMLRELRDA
jgi:two-component system, sensor histidine kinase RpfC